MNRVRALMAMSIVSASVFTADATAVVAVGETILTGVVNDAQSLIGIEGIEVSVASGGDATDPEEVLATTVTDEFGEYEIDLSEYDGQGIAFHLDVHDPDREYGGRYLQDVSIVEDDTTLANFQLGQGGVVAGTVVDVNGVPIDASCITVTDALGDQVVPYEWWQTCTTAAFFRLPALEPGDYSLAFGTPVPGAYQPTMIDVEVVAGQEEFLRVELPSTVTLVTGDVIVAGTGTPGFGDGTPIDGIEVAIRTTDSSGQHRAFSDVTEAAGEYSVDVAGFDLGPDPFVVDFLDTTGQWASEFGEELFLQAGYAEALSVDLAPGGNTVGVVTDAGGDPLPGACVIVRQAGLDAVPSDLAPCTGPTGSFTTYGVPAGEYDLFVFAPWGYQSTTVSGVTITAGSTIDVGSIALEEFPPTRVTGTVTEAGNPTQGIDGVEIAVRAFDTFGTKWAWNAFTDADGTYAVDVTTPFGVEIADWSYIVDIVDSSGQWAAEFGETVVIQPGYDAGVAAELEPGGAFDGTITGDDGSPLAGACVVVLDATGTTPIIPTDFATCTGPHGQYRTWAVPPGDYVVEVQAPAGWYSLRTDPLTIVGGPTDLDVELARIRTTITGQITDAGTGLGIAGVSVAANASGDPENPNWVYAATDVDGDYTVDLTDRYSGSGPVLVDVVDTSDVYGAVFGLEVWPQTGYAEVLAVALQPGGPIRGVVTDSSGNPVAGACVVVRDGAGDRAYPAYLEVCTDATGAFETVALPAGDYTYDVVPPTFALLDQTSVPVTVTTAGADVAPALGDRPPATLSGFASDESGAPVNGASIQVVQPGTTLEVASTTSEPTGFFELTVAPGIYDVLVKGPIGVEIGTFEEDIELIVDQTRNYVLRRFSYSVSGVAGWPLAGFNASSGSVSLGCAPTFVSVSGGVSSVDGSYSVASTSASSCSLSVSRSGFSNLLDENGFFLGSRNASYSVVEQGVALTSDVVRNVDPPVASLSLSVVNADGSPASVSQVSVNSVRSTPSSVEIFPGFFGQDVVSWSASDSTMLIGSGSMEVLGREYPVVPGVLANISVRLTNGIQINQPVNVSETGAIVAAFLIGPNGTWLSGTPGDSNDGDNVDDIVEALGPNGGDGNGDGTPDYDQANVTSLPSSAGNYVTIAAPAGTSLGNVRSIDPLDATEVATPPPSGYEFPEGITDFRVDALPVAGQDVTLEIFTQDLTGVTGYAKYDRETQTWSALPAERVVITPVDIGDLTLGGSVAITLTDGGVGDDDGVANGTVVDPGGIVRVDVIALALDDTAPVVTASVSPAPNLAGWNTTDVDVRWRAVDAVSGATQPAGSTVTGEGVFPTESEPSCDDTGNCIAGSVTVRIDRTAPTVAATVLPAPNAAGWNNEPVTVQWQCDDSLSGIATCTADQALDGEGVGQIASGTAVDAAGYTAAADVEVDIDLTPPTVECVALEPVGRNTTATVSATVTDTLSGPASPTATAALDTSAVGVFTIDVTGFDIAGNATTVSCEYEVVSTDDMPPVVTITGPQDGATYVAGSAPTPQCVTTDAESGVATSATLTLTGLNTRGVGQATARCAGAVDQAGNAAGPVSITYAVRYATAPGFFTGGQVVRDAINVGPRGATYTMRWQLRDASGALVRDRTAVQSIRYRTGWCATLIGGTESAPVNANGTLSVAANGTFRFDWRTPNVAGCHTLVISLDDGSTVEVRFLLLR